MKLKIVFYIFLWISCSALAMKEGGSPSCPLLLFRGLLGSSYEGRDTIFNQNDIRSCLKKKFKGDKESYLKATENLANQIIRESKPGSLSEQGANLAIRRLGLMDSRANTNSIGELFLETCKIFSVGLLAAWFGTEGVYPLAKGIKSEKIENENQIDPIYSGVPFFYNHIAKYTGDKAAPWVVRSVTAVTVSVGFFYFAKLKAQNIQLKKWGNPINVQYQSSYVNQQPEQENLEKQEEV